MPLDIKEFEQKGETPKREYIQENILRILEANPEQAFSSVELENALDTRRQSINQALRALEAKGLTKRGFVEQNKRQVCFVRLSTEEERNEHETEMAQPEEIPKAKKPRKKSKSKRKKSGKKKKGGKSGKSS